MVVGRRESLGCFARHSVSNLFGMMTIVRLGLASIAFIVIPHAAEALVSYGAARPLTNLVNVNDDAWDSFASVASGGNGVWMTTWSTDAYTPEPAVYLVRSIDDGATWHFVAPPVDDRYASIIASDGAGVWIFATRSLAPILFRSDDGGDSWTEVADFGGEATDNYRWIRFASDGSGAWVAVWAGRVTLGSGDFEVLYSRSVDGGLTWSAAAPLNLDAAGESDTDDSAAVSYAGGDAWVASWQRDRDVMSATSIDGGVTWSAPLQLLTNGNPLEGSDIACKSNGACILTWFDSSGAPSAAFASTSNDAGQSWSFPAILGEFAYAGWPRVVAESPNAWSVYASASIDELARTIDSEFDIVRWRSLDGGETWGPPSALSRLAAWDRGRRFESHADFDRGPNVATDGQGRWLFVWETTYDFADDRVLDTNVGRDSNVVIVEATERCPDEPVQGCVSSTIASGSRFSLKVHDHGNHKLRWSLRRGEALTSEALGDPIDGTADYSLCVWDSAAGGPKLVIEETASAAARCGVDDPCWQGRGSEVRYSDAARRNGAISMVRLQPGESGGTWLKVAGGGPTLVLPPLPLAIAPDVTAQLINVASGACWESRLTLATKNTASVLVAR